MRVLVTGANGLLGCSLVRELLRGGHDVRALVRRTSDTRGLDGLAIEKAIGDVRDRESVRNAVDGVDAVFHAAAVFAYWGYSREVMMETVRDGTGIVVEAARDAKVKRVVLTSTTAIFGGNANAAPLDESAKTIQSGPDYFVSKSIQERIAVEMSRELGVELIVVNPGLFVGPHDFGPSASSRTLTGFLRDPVRFSYPGGVSLAHVADIARGHLLALERGRPYERHILAGENIRFRDLHEILAVMTDSAGPRIMLNRTVALAGATVLELVARIVRRPPPVTRALASQIGRYFWYSSAKMRRLGYTPRSAKATVRDTLRWWTQSPHASRREQQAWSPRV